MAALRSLVVCACVLIAGPAAAQKADATAAFHRGQQLKREGKVAEACAAFELSMKLDAQLGTQYNLALCYLALGRTASAWAELDELSHKDTNPARRADAERRARELRARLVQVKVVVTQPVDGLAVSRDGLDVTALVGAATPVDPGTHRFVARAPGRRDWTVDVVVTGEAKTVEVVVPPLDPVDLSVRPGPLAPPPERAPERPSGAPPHTGAADQATGGDDDSSPDPGRFRRIAGITTFAVGVVGLGVGSGYGLRALSRGDAARAECGGDLAQCMGDAVAAQRLVEQGRSAAQISNVALIAGGVLAATGVVLYVTAPRGVTAAPVVGASTVGLVISGAL